jgi:putative phage-type endonuclease
MPEKIYYKTRQEWLQLRQNGIGASDIGAVMGLNRYTSANQVYIQKIQSHVGEDKPNRYMQIGNDLEPVIVKKYEAHTGCEIEIYKECLFYHPETPFLFASLDGVIVKPDGCRGIFEAKTSKSVTVMNKPYKWYYAQVQQQMYVMDMDWAHLVTHYYMINKTKIIHIPRDNTFIADLIEKGRAFWEIVSSVKKKTVSFTDIKALAEAQNPQSETA